MYSTIEDPPSDLSLTTPFEEALLSKMGDDPVSALEQAFSEMQAREEDHNQKLDTILHLLTNSQNITPTPMPIPQPTTPTMPSPQV